MRTVVGCLLIAALAGCVGVCLLMAVATSGARSGPESTDTSSASLPNLAERVEFLERYVSFRRHYRDLGFHIYYDRGGLVPGQSCWDIRILAVVPAGELSLWTAETAVRPPGDLGWLVDVPGAERAAGITEWHVGRNVVVGLDGEHSVVAYRYAE